MNEKEVYAMVTQKNIKLLSSYHIDDRHNYVPTKTKLNPIMFTVMNRFITNGNNILEKDGKCVKVGCVPIRTYKNSKMWFLLQRV